MKGTNPSYVMEVPELPGCLAYSATRQAVLRFWIKTAPEDGQASPRPRGRLVLL